MKIENGAHEQHIDGKLVVYGALADLKKRGHKWGTFYHLPKQVSPSKEGHHLHSVRTSQAY